MEKIGEVARSVFTKSVPFFISATKENNVAQNFAIKSNDNSKCAISGEDVYIYQTVKLKFISNYSLC